MVDHDDIEKYGGRGRSLAADELGGEPVFFKALPGLQAVEVSSPNVYPQTSEYRRMLAFIETQPGLGYAVDIFRVAGGRNHRRSFHGPSDQSSSGASASAASRAGRWPDPTFRSVLTLREPGSRSDIRG